MLHRLFNQFTFSITNAFFYNYYIESQFVRGNKFDSFTFKRVNLDCLKQVHVKRVYRIRIDMIEKYNMRFDTFTDRQTDHLYTQVLNHHLLNLCVNICHM